MDHNYRISIVKQSTNQQKLKKIINLIDQQYIREVDSDSLMDVTIHQILKGLDPHSAYLTANQQNSMSDISGQFNGLGIEYYNNNDTLTLIRTLEGSPNRNELLPGDQILRINNTSVTGDKAQGMSVLVKGREDFEIRIKRNHEIKNIKAKKENFPIQNVPSAYLIQPKVGYIKLAHFTKNASIELRKNLKRLKNLGAEKLILDVRNNGGGLLYEAESIADEFLPKGQTILFLQNEKDKSKEYFYASSGGVFEKGQLFLLINEHSASASEVLAGALQDNDRATIVGRRSFGKGLVQKEISLQDGSTFRITTAQYFTPLGRRIQKEYKNNETYNDELNSRYYSGEMYDETKIEKIDSLTTTTSNGKQIFSGGGIIPDIFVPLEQYNFGSEFYHNDGGAMIRNEVVKDIGENIPQYYNYSQEEFIRNFNGTSLFRKVFQALEQKEIEINEENKIILESYIKALVGKIVYGEDAFQKVWNSQDAMIEKVLSL